MTEAKKMSRSRNQIATSYAPESFFTFEGGDGACIAKAEAGGPIDLSESTKNQIFSRLSELSQAWLHAAMHARSAEPGRPGPVAVQCLDSQLLEGAAFKLRGQEAFLLCKPSKMGYLPAPLTFVCRTCRLFRDYKNVNDADKAIPNLSSERCPDPKKHGGCEWEQLDVVFVHWSGTWLPASPSQYNWHEGAKDVRDFPRKCTCGNDSFRLNRNSSGIGDWFFECAKCDTPLSKKWLKNDEDTLRMLGGNIEGKRITEVRMQATPYRASSAYYVKSDLFVDFKEGGERLLRKLSPGREDELEEFIARQYNLPTSGFSDEEVFEACRNKEEFTGELLDYQNAVNALSMSEELLRTQSGNATMREYIESIQVTNLNMKKRVVEKLLDFNALVAKASLSPNLRSGLIGRQRNFASKFDPFQLSVEHATLAETRLNDAKMVKGRRAFVSFKRLDEDLSPEGVDEKTQLEEAASTALEKLGIAEMGLVREFDLCKFSFGYTRMSSGPVLGDKRGINMPVRLRLFPKVWSAEKAQNPIYVVQQGNEAVYVRLDADKVLKWLQTLGCSDMFTLAGGAKIGSGIMEVAQPMGPFLDGLYQGETPPTYLYLYTLLHSYAHLLMKQMAEYSGLDIGSIGEYIFPADLAFVVYRNGTTMDLGNLSAMWRNSGTSLLQSLIQPKALQCGTGSLCAHRGGACPDCIMVPETSCIASNKLLSRSVLRGHQGRPRFDERRGSIPGYLDFS